MQKPSIMGILNITPDSFSDGGDAFDIDNAVLSARKMIDDGADILDIGAESTRPDAVSITADEEINRLKPILPLLCQSVNVPISIDTYKAKTASYALSQGASIVNDVHGLRYDPDMAKVIKDAAATCILMHQKENKSDNDDIIAHVKKGLGMTLDIALKAGIATDKIILDLGIGFGKTYAQNMTLLQEQGALKEFFGLPFLVGASRKSFINHYLNIENPKDRDHASLAVHLFALQQGAHIIRAHNVKIHRQACDMWYLLNKCAGQTG